MIFPAPRKDWLLGSSPPHVMFGQMAGCRDGLGKRRLFRGELPAPPQTSQIRAESAHARSIIP